MRNPILLAPLLFAFMPAWADEAAAAPSPSKASCDAVLTAEATRLEDGFSRTRGAWEQMVEARFVEHDNELTAAQRQSARDTFNSLVTKLSNEHVKAVALPGIYRMMLAVPRYDTSVCAKQGEMHQLGDQAIAGFLMKLTELLPLVEKSVSVAKIDG